MSKHSFLQGLIFLTLGFYFILEIEGYYRFFAVIFIGGSIFHFYWWFKHERRTKISQRTN